MWNEPVPKELGLEGQVRLSVEADLLPDGSFGRELLVVTEAKVHVVALDGAAPSVRLEFPLAELKEPKAESFFGGGALEVSHDGARVELVRYTAARARRFATAAKMLEKWLKGEKAELPPDDAERCPTCRLPLEKGTKVCPVCVSTARSLRRLMAYLRPYLPHAATLAGLATLVTALGLVIPYLQKPVIDSVLSEKSPLSLPQRGGLLTLIVLVGLGAYVLSSAAGVAQAWLSAWVGNRITHDIRCQLYSHLQYLSLSFYDKAEMGTIISRVNQDTGQLQAFLVWGSQDLVINVLQLIGIGVRKRSFSKTLAMSEWRSSDTGVPVPGRVRAGDCRFCRQRGAGSRSPGRRRRGDGRRRGAGRQQSLAALRGLALRVRAHGRREAGGAGPRAYDRPPTCYLANAGPKARGLDHALAAPTGGPGRTGHGRRRLAARPTASADRELPVRLWPPPPST